nr:sulfatase-like hydrolase/transferase [Brachybacterium squillarum]
MTPCGDAAGGARLDAMYCTDSICTPSRASILSGTYSHLHGAATIHSSVDDRVRTFPQALQDCGYRTALFGKWHPGHAPENDPQGFDEWRIYRGQGEYWGSEMYGLDAAGDRVDEPVPGYATDTVTAMALDWLDRTRAEHPEKPFCLLLHHKAPHREGTPHPPHAELHPAGSIPEPETLFDDHEGRSRAVRDVRMSIADDLTETDLKQPLLDDTADAATREEWPDAMYYRYREHEDPSHHAPAHDGIRARLEQRLAALQEHYGDRPYEGPDTPVPEWGGRQEDVGSAIGAQACDARDAGRSSARTRDYRGGHVADDGPAVRAQEDDGQRRGGSAGPRALPLPAGARARGAGHRHARP